MAQLLSAVSSVPTSATAVVAAGITASHISAAGIAWFAVTVLFGFRAAYTGAIAINSRHIADGVARTVTGTTLPLRREKFGDREFKGFKKLTGILVFSAQAAVARAVLIRHAEIDLWHQELDVTLQLDDRELAEGDDELVAVCAQIERLALEAAADCRGHFVDLAPAAAGWRTDPRFQKHGIDDFNNGARHIGLGRQLDIRRVLTEFGGENASAALAAEQDAALVVNRKTVDNGRPSNAGADLDSDPVEESDVDREKSAVELYLLDVDVDVKKLGTARFHGN